MEEKIKSRWSGSFRCVNVLWIKDQLVKSYHNIRNDMERPLIKTEIMANYGGIGYVTWALEGSPPKGLAVYLPSHKVLLIISAWGDTKKYRDVLIEGVTDHSGF